MLSPLKCSGGKDNKLHISSEAGGVAHSEDGVITRWYLHSYKGDVLACFDNNGIRQSNNVYSPYGMKYDRLNADKQVLPLYLSLSGQKPWWQLHQPGFNSQMSDPATGYQFLGGGYRAYNPAYRHFMAKDSFSPFIKIDGYGYGDNNPIMNTDPSGHMSKGWQIALEVIGIATGFLVGALMPAAMGLAAGGMASAVPSSTYAVIGVGSIASTFVAGGMGTISGGLNISRIVHPENKMVETASSAFNFIYGSLSTVYAISAILSGTAGLSLCSGVITTLSNSLAVSGGTSMLVAGVLPMLFTGLYLSGKDDNVNKSERLERMSRGIRLAAMVVSVVLDIAALGVKGIAVQNGYRVRELNMESNTWKGKYSGDTRNDTAHWYGHLRDIESDNRIDEFRGWWKNNNPSRGTLYYKKDSTVAWYEGGVNSELLEHGKGTAYMRDGSRKTGTWMHGSIVRIEYHPPSAASMVSGDSIENLDTFITFPMRNFAAPRLLFSD